MATIARVLSRASGTEVDIETLKTVVMFCGVGLTVLDVRKLWFRSEPGLFLKEFYKKPPRLVARYEFRYSFDRKQPTIFLRLRS